MSMSTTEHAAAIRAALKAKGISSRKVSVRADYFSMGSAIRIRINDASVSSALVHAIADEHERIDRCAITGDILSGCNRYLSVNYDSAALDVFAAVWSQAVQAAVDSLTVGSSSLASIDGTEFLIGRPNAFSVTVWSQDGGMHTDCCTVAGAAQWIGMRRANRGQAAA